MKQHLPVGLGVVLSVLFASALFAARADADSDPPERLDCATQPCTEVLPGAVSFETVEGQPYARGLDTDGQLVGWVALSIDVVDIPAYSGKPMATLIGLDTEGVIVGAQVIHHSEPILLVGIPTQALTDFVALHTGHRADVHIVVGRGRDDAIAVDVISGATVTALAESRTLLETARVVGAAVGVISATAAVPGEFVVDEEPWSWARMEEEGVFGRLTVSQEDMGRTSSRGPFVDLWYTIADAPHIGRALLGESDYAHSMQLLSPGEHLVIVLGNGTESFKGSAFVRGGIFDRVRLQQGLREISFRDVDYQNLGRVRAAGAPRFREGAVFIARGGRLDPGAEYSMVFLGSRYDGRGGFSRDFREFSSTHQLPRSVYEVQRSAADSPIWVQAWRNRSVDVALLSLFLLFVIGVFSARRYTTADHKRLKRLHVGTMLFSFLFMGVYLHAQPSVTQILTLVDSVVHGMRFELFASEPLLFVSWIFIAIVSLIWGRGVFCGWVCPYGALTELLFLIGQKLGIKNYELPDKLHRPLRYLRFVLLLGLIPVFLTSPIVGEKLAEIEPFKSTFLVPAWTREWYFAAWWVLLLVVATFWYRPFCRYICPLGGGLAIFNRFRFSGPYRRNFCTNCTICAKGCEPKAIRPDGTIDAMDCLSCMECEATYRDDTTCPPLVGIERLMSKVERTKREEEKLLSLREDAKKV